MQCLLSVYYLVLFGMHCHIISFAKEIMWQCYFLYICLAPALLCCTVTSVLHAFCAFVLLVPTFLCTHETGCNGQCSMSTCLLQSLFAGFHFHLPTLLWHDCLQSVQSSKPMLLPYGIHPGSQLKCLLSMYLVLFGMHCHIISFAKEIMWQCNSFAFVLHLLYCATQ